MTRLEEWAKRVTDGMLATWKEAAESGSGGSEWCRRATRAVLEREARAFLDTWPGTNMDAFLDATPPTPRGMEPGQRCTRPIDHERTWKDGHEYDKATELRAPWDHGLGVRCEFVAPPIATPPADEHPMGEEGLARRERIRKNMAAMGNPIAIAGDPKWGWSNKPCSDCAPQANPVVEPASPSRLSTDPAQTDNRITDARPLPKTAPTHVGPKSFAGHCTACLHPWDDPPDYPPCESTGAAPTCAGWCGTTPAPDLKFYLRDRHGAAYCTEACRDAGHPLAPQGDTVSAERCACGKTVERTPKAPK